MGLVIGLDLALSSCNINEFPEMLSTANNLWSLDLSANKIHGHIPNWLFNISTLSSLNLSHNFLTGIEQFPWENLQYLDLRSNLLQGTSSSTTFSAGKQFNSFQNDSYIGNLGLCGLPLSETCSNDEAPESKATILQDEQGTWKAMLVCEYS
ncbi:hypothetical protein JRO89_XS15G0174200 [Xanthoceras sorbifolium]|uniref:Uncharacterized protein n=1 Tax=Xanthoceras sorbifolium TaxID=99658 RepID=A0ABQ8H2Q5_9ROSI|nr:hypothetical protein JRO89_XS15G0174200 [Xanthoceras sorbifolium]